VDTRSKIFPLAAVAGERLPRLVAGFFDPLIAAHAEALAALGDRLTVCILDPPNPLLPASARAELAASLACVERVILGDARPFANSVVDLTAAHLELRASLEQHVLARLA
jgi:hypothetical protein